VAAIAAFAAAFVFSAIGARAPDRVPALALGPPPVPLWRRRLARALPSTRTLPVPLTWVSAAAVGLYALVALRLLQLGTRAGFL
jgi:hypothetical protein